VLSANPAHVDALINLGMLSYDGGDLEKSGGLFSPLGRAGRHNAVAAVQSGSVLEEMASGRSGQHFASRVRLTRVYADAHYNLAFVCEKLSARAEARSIGNFMLNSILVAPGASTQRQRLAAKT